MLQVPLIDCLVQSDDGETWFGRTQVIMAIEGTSSKQAGDRWTMLRKGLHKQLMTQITVYEDNYRPVCETAPRSTTKFIDNDGVLILLRLLMNNDSSRAAIHYARLRKAAVQGQLDVAAKRPREAGRIETDPRDSSTETESTETKRHKAAWHNTVEAELKVQEAELKVQEAERLKVQEAERKVQEAERRQVAEIQGKALRNSGVYVIRTKNCDRNGNAIYYVGHSQNIEKRISEHRSNCKGWVRTNGGVAAVEVPLTPRMDHNQSWETLETVIRMIQHGFENVRGAKWSNSVPLVPQERTEIAKDIYHLLDLCGNCGGTGHFAQQCTINQKPPWLKSLLPEKATVTLAQVFEHAVLTSVVL